MNFSIDEKYGLPVLVVNQLEVVANNVLENRADCLGLFVGGERLGKSTLQSRFALCLADKLATKVELKNDYHYDLLTFVKDLLQTKYPDNPDNPLSPKPGGVHYVKVYDEPVLGANARKWRDSGNVLLNQVLATIGYKYLVILASIPSFFMLDNMIREHRVAFLCRIHATVDDNHRIKKGFFSLYNGEQVKRVYRDQKTRQVIWPRTPYNYLKFSGMQGTPFWNEYEVFSSNAKQKVGEELLENLENLAKGKEDKKSKSKDDVFIEELVSKIGNI